MSTIKTKLTDFAALLSTERVFFLIGIHYMQQCTTTTRQEFHVTIKKISKRRLNQTGNMCR